MRRRQSCDTPKSRCWGVSECSSGRGGAGPGCWPLRHDSPGWGRPEVQPPVQVRDGPSAPLTAPEETGARLCWTSSMALLRRPLQGPLKHVQGSSWSSGRQRQAPPPAPRPRPSLLTQVNAQGSSETESAGPPGTAVETCVCTRVHPCTRTSARAQPHGPAGDRRERGDRVQPRLAPPRSPRA